MNMTLNDLLHLAVLGSTLLLLNMPAPSRASETKPYPLQTCLVTGNELGSMGKVIAKTYAGREIKLCCKPCVKKFDASPAKYLVKLK